MSLVDGKIIRGMGAKIRLSGSNACMQLLDIDKDGVQECVLIGVDKAKGSTAVSLFAFDVASGEIEKASTLALAAESNMYGLAAVHDIDADGVMDLVVIRACSSLFKDESVAVSGRTFGVLEHLGYNCDYYLTDLDGDRQFEILRVVDRGERGDRVYQVKMTFTEASRDSLLTANGLFRDTRILE